MIRSVTRRSYVHKEYVNFDISKVIQIEKTKYEQGTKAVVQNEIEIELSGRNRDYDKHNDKNALYADSLLLKLLDIIYCISKSSKGVSFVCERVSQ